MLEKYIKPYSELFKTLKAKKFFLSLKLIREKIIEKIRSDNMSPEVHCYFEHIETKGVPFSNFDKEPLKLSN